MPSSKIDDSAVYDLIGLGFGPANLAIAGAVIEKRTSTSSGSFPIEKVLFIEKHDKFRWHPGMLLPDARMQISFMKDLATLRNPQSPITFLAYLHSQDRLVSFINRGSMVPSRKEFADYLSWAAQYVKDNGVDVLYGHEVIRLSRGEFDTINIHSRNVATGEQRVIKARDIVISPGGAPRIPESIVSISDHPFVIHSSAYATSIEPVLKSLASKLRPLRVAIIGSGQSAAEVTMDLRERLSLIPCAGFRHELDMIIRKGSLKPSDDSPFANEIFDPSSTETWFNMPTERIRASRLAEYKSTNYGVVNPRTLEILHEVIYDQKLDEGIAKRTASATSTHPHINILPYTSIISTNTNHTPVSSSNNLQTKNDDASLFSIITQNVISRAISEVRYDMVICATGYQRSCWINLLKDSDIGKNFGLHSASSTVQLLPISRCRSRHVDFHLNEAISSSGTPSPSSDSACSTPPTSPHPSTFSSPHIDSQIPDTVYISRNYRLLPSSPEGCGEAAPQLKSRVYLQGVEEATHGLSDTLLSVLGVRAGEVVGDICHRD
ncbi:hypothetical protein D9615_004010 [Tricholomella constricta]|uniref:L-ornithine N(5)-monooxygenase [NAD(P)H] n=1 Tax=Tricholomella constricta TaxID=117010 RepID=A0A8H5HD24_9AGAR|nr:hypothetical protein D9615_004010 [Tricholomella constricta]